MIVDDIAYGRAEITEPVALSIISSKLFQRLKGISNIGIPIEFIPSGEKGFTRYDHSIGAMLILRRLGASLEEQVAGLLHDVSHTAFSHVIDYVLKEDGGKEDYQDSIHNRFFNNGSELATILERHGLDPGRISEPNNYSLLEQEQPEVCADRFDYTVRWWAAGGDMDFVNDALESVASVGGVMTFRRKESALKFAEKHISVFGEGKREGLRPSEIYVIWYVFAGALRMAVRKGIIAVDDFSGTDSEVMKKINRSGDAEILGLFDALRGGLEFELADVNPKVAISKKFRYTDPRFIENGVISRVSEAYPKYKSRIEEDKAKNTYGFGIASIKGIKLPIA